jgi:hypothetical protein
MAGMSEYLKKALLEHITDKKAYTAPTNWVALCTVVPTASSTGSTITEATYTGYEREEFAGAAFNAATAEAIKNAAEKVLKGCTAGKSTLIGWAVCDAKTGGNVIEWGTVTSTEVSTTATPPKIAAEALIYELK